MGEIYWNKKNQKNKKKGQRNNEGEYLRTRYVTTYWSKWLCECTH
jgi:hypothetical protein